MATDSLLVSYCLFFTKGNNTPAEKLGNNCNWNVFTWKLSGFQHTRWWILHQNELVSISPNWLPHRFCIFNASCLSVKDHLEEKQSWFCHFDRRPWVTVTWYWCMMCLFDFLSALSFMYNKTSCPTLRCAIGDRAERPQMVYANDNTSLIHQVKFRRYRYPWAHPLWFVEWSSTWWPMHLWPGLTK